MRILLVTYYFPPSNTMGAVRTGKTALWLARMGHDVRVLTARDVPLPETLPVEFPEERVTRTGWTDVNRPVQLLLGGRRRVAEQGYTVRGVSPNWTSRLGGWYRKFLHLPDAQIGWYRPAVRAGVRLAQGWRPDVILASAMPATTALVGARLSRLTGVPWIAEMRDLWVDGPNYPHRGLRRVLEQRLERRTLKTATGIVTVSEPMAHELATTYRLPTELVLNGYDPNDFDERFVPERGTGLVLRYLGMVYQGKRDPGPLFEALRLLSPGEDVRVEFYGRYLDHVREQVALLGIADRVRVQAPVSYQESLRLQQTADALVLLLWNGAGGEGVFTGKLFEYLGARRPILAIGPDDNAASKLIVERGAGTIAAEPKAIAAELRRWLAVKRKAGELPALPTSVRTGLSRAEQTARLAKFVERLVPAA